MTFSNLFGRLEVDFWFLGLAGSVYTGRR